MLNMIDMGLQQSIDSHILVAELRHVCIRFLKEEPMISNTIKVVAPLLLAACAMPAFAQDQVQAEEKPEKIVLEQKVGSVMASTGGDYESANIGKVLIRDESLMVADGAKATVVYYYDNGKRKCTEVYKGPNTFVIDDSCKKAAYMEGNGGKIAGLIAGAALLGAAVIGQDSDDNFVPPPPVSGSSR